ncbi:MAG: GC-type dockerin domain-anchored protein [Phycisphaerales bacterium JB041]
MKEHQMHNTITALAFLACLTAAAEAQVAAYEDEESFLQDLAALGYTPLAEDFEGAAWDDYRTTNPFDPQAAPEVTSKGLTWSGNDWITTNTNWGRGGSWGVFTALVNGGFPEWFRIESDQPLYAAGGWFNSNPDGGADIGIVLDGAVVASRQIGAGHQFIGVILPDAFTSVEFVDLEAEAAIGADDFTFAVLDICEADFNGDGTVNTLDVLVFLNAWTAGDSAADFNDDGTVNTLDVLAFLNAWSTGC